MTTEYLTPSSLGAAYLPRIRHIGMRDVGAALAAGFDDFRANPTHLIILCLVYPVMGLVLGRIASGSDSLPLVWPLVAGFALIGPIASVGLYDLSRQRERGRAVTWRNATDVFRSPQIGAILLLAFGLIAVFVAWIVCARLIYDGIMPPHADETISGFIQAVTTTESGTKLIVIGTVVGFLFALVVLTLGVFSIPMLVDRGIGATAAEQAALALQTSLRAAINSPVAVLAWGVVIVLGMAIGAGTLLVGFAVVMPVLGHATWHLYRRAIG